LKTTGEGRGKRSTVKDGEGKNLEKLLMAEASSKPLKTEREEQQDITPTAAPPVPSYTTISERVVAKERNISDPKEIKQRARELRVKVRDNAKVVACLETTGEGKRKRHIVKPGKENDLEQLLMAAASSKPQKTERKEQPGKTPTKPAATQTTESPAQETYESAAHFLQTDFPAFFDECTPGSRSVKATGLVKLLVAAGHVKKRARQGNTEHYLDPGDTETREKIRAYCREHLTSKGTKKKTGHEEQQAPTEPAARQTTESPARETYGSSKQDKPVAARPGVNQNGTIEAYVTRTYFSQLGRKKQLQEVDGFLEFLINEDAIESNEDLVTESLEKDLNEWLSLYREERQEKQNKKKETTPKQSASQTVEQSNIQYVRKYTGELIGLTDIVKRIGIPWVILKESSNLSMLGKHIVVRNKKGNMIRGGYNTSKAEKFIKTYKII